MTRALSERWACCQLLTRLDSCVGGYTDFLYQKFHHLPYTLALKSFLERFKLRKGPI